MIDENKIIAIIPARGGSKGLPRKNIRLLNGKPLIAWTIEAAHRSRYIDRVILSSEDDEIIAIAKAYNCDVPFKRNSNLATDDTSSIAVVIDALNKCPGYGLVVLLQPTSPLRTTEDIDQALEKLNASNAPACVTVCETEQSPYWMFTLGYEERLKAIVPAVNFTRRQEIPSTYMLNGAVYVARIKWLLDKKTFITTDTIAHVMPIARSIDIDTEHDFLKSQSIY